jgi:hypothetical protein
MIASYSVFMSGFPDLSRGLIVLHAAFGGKTYFQHWICRKGVPGNGRRSVQRRREVSRFRIDTVGLARESRKRLEGAKADVECETVRHITSITTARLKLRVWRFGRAARVVPILFAGSLIVAPRPLRAQQSTTAPTANDEARTADVAGLTVATSRCAISANPTYGTTRENPIKLGGGPIYLASREMKYLSALRGPAGQGLHFKRLGSTPAAGDDTILDNYIVEYAGIPQPTAIYIDGYHWDPPQAPAGWLCGADMNLGRPGPDPFETRIEVMELAIGQSDREVVPISLDEDGSKTHGVAFDHARLVTAAVRVAAARGAALTPRSLPPELAQPHIVIFAFPLTCGGKRVLPLSVTLSDGRGNAPRLLGTLTGDKVPSLVPEFRPPAGAIASTYAAPTLIDGATTTVHYEAACGDAPADVVMTVKGQRGRVLKSVPAIVPASVAVVQDGAQVRVQVLIDDDDVPRFPTYVSGPEELADAAIEAAKQWRVETIRLNGAPILQPITLAIPFSNR